MYIIILFLNFHILIQKELFESHEASKCLNSSYSVYDFHVRKIDHEIFSVSEYKNKILLIANIASFTKDHKQFFSFNSLIEEYGYISSENRCGLKILAFPCHQFGHLEPANNHEIPHCLRYVRPGNGFEPKFEIFAKIAVNGDLEHPLFNYLKNVCPYSEASILHEHSPDWKTVKSTDIPWNFVKFLVDHKGRPVSKYMPNVDPIRIKDEIDALIHSCLYDH